MDGVLWHDNAPIGDLPEVFAAIRRMGLKVTFCTNNATKSALEFQQKLLGFGVEVASDQILTSADAALAYIVNNYAQGRRIYAVGSQSLLTQVREMNLIALDPSENEGADVVLAALDTQLTYQKIANAAMLIRKGARFIATNTDKTYPTPLGLMPGAGTVVAAITAASGEEPLVIGKPQPAMFLQAMERMGTRPAETLCVGDRLETDILGGQDAGCLTALVLTGVSTAEQAAQWQPKPTLIARNLMGLLNG